MDFKSVNCHFSVDFGSEIKTNLAPHQRPEIDTAKKYLKFVKRPVVLEDDLTPFWQVNPCHIQSLLAKLSVVFGGRFDENYDGNSRQASRLQRSCQEV